MTKRLTILTLLSISLVACGEAGNESLQAESAMEESVDSEVSNPTIELRGRGSFQLFENFGAKGASSKDIARQDTDQMLSDKCKPEEQPCGKAAAIIKVEPGKVFRDDEYIIIYQE